MKRNWQEKDILLNSSLQKEIEIEIKVIFGCHDSIQVTSFLTSTFTNEEIFLVNTFKYITTLNALEFSWYEKVHPIN